MVTPWHLHLRHDYTKTVTFKTWLHPDTYTMITPRPLHLHHAYAWPIQLNHSHTLTSTLAWWLDPYLYVYVMVMHWPSHIHHAYGLTFSHQTQDTGDNRVNAHHPPTYGIPHWLRSRCIPRRRVPQPAQPATVPRCRASRCSYRGCSSASLRKRMYKILFHNTVHISSYYKNHVLKYDVRWSRCDKHSNSNIGQTLHAEIWWRQTMC